MYVYTYCLILTFKAAVLWTACNRWVLFARQWQRSLLGKSLRTKKSHSVLGTGRRSKTGFSFANILGGFHWRRTQDNKCLWQWHQPSCGLNEWWLHKGTFHWIAVLKKIFFKMYLDWILPIINIKRFFLWSNCHQLQLVSGPPALFPIYGNMIYKLARLRSGKLTMSSWEYGQSTRAAGHNYLGLQHTNSYKMRHAVAIRKS